MITYYRIHDVSRSAPESLLSPDSRSRVWVGSVFRPCADCGQRGGSWAGDEDEPEWSDCAACDGAGELVIDWQRGTSVCRSVGSLRSYMVGRHGRVDADCVLLEVEGDEMDEADVDAADGAVLVQVTRIVSATPVSDSWLSE